MKKNSSFVFLFFYLSIIANLFICAEAMAFKFTKEVCEKYNLGSNWYCEDTNKKEKQDESVYDKIDAEDIMSADMPAVQKSALLNELWEYQSKKAVITESQEDIKAAIRTQRFIAKKGTDYAKHVSRIIETEPEFSIANSYYKSASESKLNELQKESTLKTAARKYSIAFVYKAGCPYCQGQLPILQDLKERWGIATLGVSVDGNYYPGLDENITDKDITNDPTIKSYPTLFLMDLKNSRRIFLAKGLTTLDQLENRIFNRIQENESKFYEAKHEKF